MAHFIAEIQGHRGPASRLGTKSSGINANARGWNVGVSIVGHHTDSSDVFEVRAFGGSNNGSGRVIATVREGADGLFTVTHHPQGQDAIEIAASIR